MKLFSWIVFAAILLSFGTVRSEELPLVTAIEVKGVKRIEEGSLRARISQKIGTPLSSEKTTDDIKTIFKMGYFDDVRVDIEPFEGGIKVIYTVKEKPTIIRVDFQGNKKFGDDKIKEHVTLSPGAIADVTLINDNAGRLRAFYEDEGYYLAAIVPVVRKVEENEVAVTYHIDEGKKIKIKSITIEGNRALSDSKIKRAMKIKERGIFSFVTSTGYYKKEEMRADVERIKDLYFNHGYIKATVGDPQVQLTKDREGMTITIPVSEGDPFKVSGVEIAGNKAFAEKELRPLIKMAPNTVFSKETLSKDVAALSEKYSNNGYALVSIFPDLIPDEDKKVTKVIYRINEGEKYAVGRIDITGNTKTRDKVIRREIRLDEGEVFNAAALKRSYERLNNLQYFEAVDLSPKPNPETRTVDLDVTIKEKPTGFLSVGGGYSSVDKFIAMVDITQGNLFGRGQYLKLKGELGGSSSFYELSFRDPWFLDRPLAFGASLYKTTRSYDEFDRRSTGVELSLGKSFWEYWSGGASYIFEKARIFNVADDASSTVKEQEGTSTTSSISLSLGRDTRDNYLDPSRGSKNALYLTFAGLGGTNKFLKVLYDSGWYFPLFRNTTFHARGRLGYATGLFGEELPLYERYYVGGIYTVRGLGFGEGGPRDINGSAIGGEKELIFNFEYIFPIVTDYKLKGLLFFDAGRAYGAEETFGSDLRYTAGTGIRWISPMGPIRIEWGYNLDKRTGESASKVEFTFGTFF
ncbi:MAG: outer membrane protein assembly factor BamA [Alphaproteobacteria bacterium]|uniref:Outer membrane protein assembly factor BamA n=1 Tax=Candidatus Nitrobium versatile TaxID=2884831 RepID=A0A953J944_9BACT|nr:outer membrane protein assembly factor BamA [Candidatus Nitrobium versatile]